MGLTALLLGTAKTATAAAAPGLFGTAGKFALAQTLTTLGTTAGVAGAIQTGQAAQAQAESAEAVAAHNILVQEQEAEAIRQKAKFEQQRLAKRGERVKSTLTARIAKAGGLGAPVAADLAAEQAAELELEELLVGFRGEVGAKRALSQAELDRISGRVAKRKGRATVTAARFGAGETLLTGFGKAFE
jgi:hypothetical protein